VCACAYMCLYPHMWACKTDLFKFCTARPGARQPSPDTLPAHRHSPLCRDRWRVARVADLEREAELLQLLRAPQHSHSARNLPQTPPHRFCDIVLVWHPADAPTRGSVVRPCLCSVSGRAGIVLAAQQKLPCCCPPECTACCAATLPPTTLARCSCCQEAELSRALCDEPKVEE